MKIAFCTALALAAASACPVAAQQTSSTGFKAADDRMMQSMGKPLTGDADRDFVAQMTPHHQGAIDMAQVELKYGTDPTLKRLAQRVIKAQEEEIAEMAAWLAKHPAR